VHACGARGQSAEQARQAQLRAPALRARCAGGGAAVRGVSSAVRDPPRAERGAEAGAELGEPGAEAAPQPRVLILAPPAKCEYARTVRACSLLLLCAGTFACASSSVVAPHDAVFERAQSRLARTRQLVEETAAAPDEKLLFMQAESYYRYR